MKICPDAKNISPPVNFEKDGIREVMVTIKSKMKVSSSSDDKEYIVSKLKDNEDGTASNYITLLDAMFYSSYTVTTTGYGIVPLDKWIKFFTIFENLIEFLIVTGFIGVVIGQKS